MNKLKKFYKDHKYAIDMTALVVGTVVLVGIILKVGTKPASALVPTGTKSLYKAGEVTLELADEAVDGYNRVLHAMDNPLIAVGKRRALIAARVGDVEAYNYVMNELDKWIKAVKPDHSIELLDFEPVFTSQELHAL